MCRRRKVPKAEDQALLKDCPSSKSPRPGCPGPTRASPSRPAMVRACSSPGWYGHLWGELTAPAEGGLSPRAFTAHLADARRGAVAQIRPHHRHRLGHRGGAAGRDAGGPARAAVARPSGNARRQPRRAVRWRDAAAQADRDRLVIGDDVGAVDDGVPQMPLQPTSRGSNAAEAQAGGAGKPSCRWTCAPMPASPNRCCCTGSIHRWRPAWGRLSDPGAAVAPSASADAALGAGILRAPCRGARAWPDHRGGGQKRGCIEGKGSRRSRCALVHRSGLPSRRPRRRGAGRHPPACRPRGGYGRYRRAGGRRSAAGDDPALRHRARNAGGRVAPPGHEPDRGRVRGPRIAAAISTARPRESCARRSWRSTAPCRCSTTRRSPETGAARCTPDRGCRCRGPAARLRGAPAVRAPR